MQKRCVPIITISPCVEMVGFEPTIRIRAAFTMRCPSRRASSRKLWMGLEPMSPTWQAGVLPLNYQSVLRWSTDISTYRTNHHLSMYDYVASATSYHEQLLIGTKKRDFISPPWLLLLFLCLSRRYITRGYEQVWSRDHSLSQY